MGVLHPLVFIMNALHHKDGLRQIGGLALARSNLQAIKRTPVGPLTGSDFAEAVLRWAANGLWNRVGALCAAEIKRGKDEDS